MRLYDEHVTDWDGVVEWFERNGYEEAPEVGEILLEHVYRDSFLFTQIFYSF